jgi:hypothetical protein
MTLVLVIRVTMAEPVTHVATTTLDTTVNVRKDTRGETVRPT